MSALTYDWKFVSEIKESLKANGYDPKTATSHLVQLTKKGKVERQNLKEGNQSRFYDVKYRLAGKEGSA